MAGTLSVQKIQGLASSATPTVVEVSSGHALHVNTLKGTTTAGSITVQSEGTPTTNLQKGLAKVTGHLTLAGVSDADASLNISSVTDGSTGKNTIFVTNAFSSATAAVGNISNHDDSYNRGTGIRDASASQFETFMFQASSGSLSDNDTDHSVTIHGDLA